MDRPELARYWDDAYRRRGFEGVSGPQPTPTLPPVDRVARRGAIRSAGRRGRQSVPLVDPLVVDGFEDVTVLDVSAVAFDEARRRLGDAEASIGWSVMWRRGSAADELAGVIGTGSVVEATRTERLATSDGTEQPFTWVAGRVGGGGCPRVAPVGVPPGGG